MIYVLTDSASDIASHEFANVEVLPMTISFDEKDYLDGVDISKVDFYHKLIESDVLPTTSQLNPFVFEQAIEKLRGDDNFILIITLSAKLSGTYQNAVSAAEKYKERVYVLDSENVTIGERIVVERALQLIDEGLPFYDLAEVLEREKKQVHLLALLDTLEYLKRGGRISPAVAAAAGLLSIKAVVSIVEGEVCLVGKARGSKRAENHLNELVERHGIDFSRPYSIGYTGLSDHLLQKYLKDSEKIWVDQVKEINPLTVGATIGTHAGPNAIAVAFFAKDNV